MSYTCDKILSMSRSIDEFQKKVAITKNLNIVESIDKFYNNFYDMLFYIEEQFCYYNDRYYNPTKTNMIRKQFESLNRIKKRAKRYYEDIEAYNNDNNESKDFLKNELDEEYSDLIAEYTDALSGILAPIQSGEEPYTKMNYTYPFKQSDNYTENPDVWQIVSKVLTRIPSNGYGKHKLFVMENSINSFTGASTDLALKDNYEVFGYFNQRSISTNRVDNIYDRYILGSLSTCKISNGVFDIVYCDARDVSFYSLDQVGKFQSEYNRLINSLKYIKPDGLLIYMTYYFRFTKDVSSLLAKYLKDVNIFTAPDSKVVIITGNRRKDKVPDQELFNRLRRLYKFDEFESDDPETVQFYVGKTNYEVPIFRGFIVTEGMISQTLVKHDLIADIFNTNNQTSETKRPLLPFSIGQLGLVLTSGCLDGIIEEKDSHNNAIGAHVIKGTVIKQKENVSSTTSEKFKTSEETITNKVSINIFEPDGELLTLV